MIEIGTSGEIVHELLRVRFELPRLPLLGYLGVALLNNCPPDDMDLFWERLVALLEPKRPGQPAAQMAVNNLILSEQIYYQTGYRMPYVRAHGLYTNMGYAPTKPEEILIWRAPLFSYVTTRCAMMHFSVANPQLRMKFHFMEDSGSGPELVFNMPYNVFMTFPVYTHPMSG